jgi:hypothetical protein
MTVKTTTDRKGPNTTTDTPKQSCCDGNVTAESRTDASKPAGHGHHEHAVPSKAAESSCCCGTAKDSRLPDPKDRSAASK